MKNYHACYFKEQKVKDMKQEKSLKAL